MSYPINYPTPQGANVQIFQGGDPQTAGHYYEKTWVKPQGASFVWFTLIGAGGGGDNATTGGGSGAVTNCMVPAFLIPDVLTVVVGVGGPLGGADGGSSSVYYQQKDTAGYLLLTAQGGNSSGGAGTASTSNYFSCMGFFQSITGQTGTTGSQTASTTTFLSGGSIGTQTISGNYGYQSNLTGSNGGGTFRMQPIIVGTGGAGTAKGGVGCGGGVGGAGGDGLVVIITW